MTISFPTENSRPKIDRDHIKEARTGTTFVAHDSDGEDWAFLKTDGDTFVTLGSTKDNYWPGTIYNWDELEEVLNDYNATVEIVDFILKVDDGE